MTALRLLPLLLATFFSTDGLAEQSYSTRTQENIIPPAEWQSLNTPGKPTSGLSRITEPDEQSLWDLLGQQDYAGLEQAIDQTRARFPQWHPPAALQSALAQGELEQRINSAIETQNDRELLRLEAEHPAQFDCGNISRVWAGITARLRLRDVASALSNYSRLLRDCKTPADWIATLHHAFNTIDHASFDILLQSAQQWPASLRDSAQAQDVIIQHQITQISTLYPAQPSLARSRLIMISPSILQWQRSGAARQLGWLLYQNGEFTEAEFWFHQSLRWSGDEESAYGLTLSVLRQGNMSAARAAAHDSRWASPRLRELYRDILAELALDSHNLGDFSTSAALFDEAEQYASLNQNVQVARAWNAYQLHRYTEAATLFVPLYLKRRDNETARGTYFALKQARQRDTLNRLVQETDGPLDALFRADLGQSLLFAQRYRRAVAGGFDVPPTLINVDSPQIIGAGISRWRDSESGLGELHIRHVPAIAGSWQRGYHLAEIRASRLQLDSGSLSADALIGTAPLQPRPFDFSVDTVSNAGLDWRANYTYLGPWEWQIALGDTPWFDSLDAGPLFTVGFGRRSEVDWSITISRDSVRDSLLSYTGQRDPYSGLPWGAVTETGLNLSYSSPLSDRWSLGAEFTRARLRGSHVADNNSTHLRVRMDRAISHRNGTLVRAGPYLEHRAYDKNLSLFTLGHGGYFSPQQLNGIGIAASYATPDGQRQVIHANVELGYQKFTEDAAPYFPLAPDGRTYRQSEDTHTLVRIELKSVFKLTSGWLGGGAINYLDAPSARDTSVGLFLTYSQKPRKSVVGSDMPAFIFDAVY